MTKKYILTGGPGTGKSSILLALEQRGEYTLAEAATDIIRYQQALRNLTPWIDTDRFQGDILDLQLRREKNIPTGIERGFIDRGILDGAAYYIKDNKEIPAKLEEEAKKTDYEKIFLIENLGHCLKTGVRRENLEESLQLEGILEKLYRKHGYEITRIGPGTVEERAQSILKAL